MKVSDTVYGRCHVEEPVLQELIDADPVQRLKAVKQAGPAAFVKPKPVTRYDHSVGVMLLLDRFGATPQEKIAGLLHDVSHTAFSHVADFVFEDEAHEYHERFLEDVVRDSSIPAILDDHGFDPATILDEDGFPLLERDIPDLCADRIDYFLRDWTTATGSSVDHFLDALDTRDDLFVLTDRDVAEEYALTYIEADERLWADPVEVAAFELFARALREALDTGVLAEDDLFGTDGEVLEALEASDNDRITGILDLLRDGIEVEAEADAPDLEAATKPRYVDPLVIDGGTVRVTDYSEELRRRIEDHRREVRDGYRLRIAGAQHLI